MHVSRIRCMRRKGAVLVARRAGRRTLKTIVIFSLLKESDNQYNCEKNGKTNYIKALMLMMPSYGLVPHGLKACPVRLQPYCQANRKFVNCKSTNFQRRLCVLE